MLLRIYSIFTFELIPTSHFILFITISPTIFNSEITLSSILDQLLSIPSYPTIIIPPLDRSILSHINPRINYNTQIRNPHAYTNHHQTSLYYMKHFHERTIISNIRSQNKPMLCSYVILLTLIKIIIIKYGIS